MKFSARTAIAAVAILATGCSTSEGALRGTAPQAAESPAPSQPRFVNQIDLAPLIKRFLGPHGFLDPAFPPTVAHASPYLTDFFGVQAIADLPADRIIADLVPRFASVTARTDDMMTLKFKKGYSATFYPLSTLSVMGAAAPVSHAAFTGDDWRSVRANIGDFIETLRSAGLDRTYLVPNRTYRDEQVTERHWGMTKAAPVKVDPALATFAAAPDAVLLVPEAVHGKSVDADALMEIIDRHEFDWIGLEMLPSSMQPELSAFNKAKTGSPEYAEARAKLIAYFAESWNGRAGPKTTGEENYYFKLVEAAHARNIRVVGLEEASVEFLLFRYGETSFGGAVRSYQWAKHAPATGRGIIFGGSAHFNEPKPVNVQDFLVAKTPGRPIFSLKPINPRPAG